jgi:hypothetical protein
MTESNEVKIPQYIKIVALLEVCPDTYEEMLSWGKTPDKILQEVRKGIHIESPAPTCDAEVQSIEEIYGCGIGGALRQRIDKITNGGAL